MDEFVHFWKEGISASNSCCDLLADSTCVECGSSDSKPFEDLDLGLDWEGISASTSCCDLLADFICIERGCSNFELRKGYVTEHDDSESDPGM